jgi:hypothetical protein
MKPNTLKEKTCAFALRTVAPPNLLKDQKENGIAGQVLRSSTA